MKVLTEPLTKEEISELHKSYGNYIKVTGDIERKVLVIGIALHADAEKTLLEMGGKPENLWGGGVNLSLKLIDATAVFNLRPRLGNNNVEILNPDIRKRFMDLVEYIFKNFYE
jgi:hypothetical protein